LTIEELRKRVQRRFFGKEAAIELSKDLWELREVIRAASSKAWGVTSSQEWGYKGCEQVSPEVLVHLGAIEQRIKQARPTASPKTLEGLNLMTRAITDIRSYCNKKKS
jgi:hypothetical protein